MSALHFTTNPPTFVVPKRKRMDIFDSNIKGLENEVEALTSLRTDSLRKEEINSLLTEDIINGQPPTLLGKGITGIERYPAYNIIGEADILAHKLHPEDLLRLPSIHYYKLKDSYNVNNDGYCTAANNIIHNKDWSFFSPVHDVDQYFGSTNQVFTYSNYSNGSWVFAPPPIKDIQDVCYDHIKYILEETVPNIVVYFLIIGNQQLVDKVHEEKYFSYETIHNPNSWIMHRYNGQPVTMNQTGTFVSLRKLSKQLNPVNGWVDDIPTDLNVYSPYYECKKPLSEMF